MHAVDLIHAALDQSDADYPDIPGDDIAPGICCVTGVEYAQTLQRSALLGPSFTAGALLARPDSDRVGLPAYISLRYKWERMSCWIVTCDGFRRLTRDGVRDAVLGNPPDGPWAGYATTSYKKHGALLAPVNTGRHAIWQWDEMRVDCTDRAAVMAIWTRMREAQDAGIPRPVLETLDASQWLIGKIGLRRWMEIKKWAEPLRDSAIYRFLAYLLPSAASLAQEQP